MKKTITLEEFEAGKEYSKQQDKLFFMFMKNKRAENDIWMKRFIKVKRNKKRRINQGYSQIGYKFL